MYYSNNCVNYCSSKSKSPGQWSVSRSSQQKTNIIFFKNILKNYFSVVLLLYTHALHKHMVPPHTNTHPHIHWALYHKVVQLQIVPKLLNNHHILKKYYKISLDDLYPENVFYIDIG